MAGTFSRSVHCAVKLVTCTRQTFSFSISLRRAALSLRGSLCKRHCKSSQCCNVIATSSSQGAHAKMEKATAGSYSPAARAASPSPAAPCTASLPLHSLSQSGVCRSWAAVPSAGQWGSAQEHGWADGAALRCASHSLAAEPLWHRHVGASFPFSHPLSSQQIIGILFSKIRNLRDLSGVGLDQAFFFIFYFFFSAAQEKISFSFKALP